MGGSTILELKKVERLEDIVSIKPGETLPGEKFEQVLSIISMEVLLKEAKLDNYRDHTIKGTKGLSNSIGQVGLLEPIILSFDTHTQTIALVDGEGRFWSSYDLNARFVPAIIYYDVTEEDRIRMKAAANAMKVPISSEDIAFFAKNLKEKLQEHHNQKELGDVTLKELSEVMGRDVDTISNYLLFTELPDNIVDYVREHPGEHYFSRAVKVGRVLKDNDKRIEFFKEVIDDEEKNGRMSPQRFNSRLKTRSETDSGQVLSVQNDNHNAVKDIEGELLNSIRNATRYTDAFNYFIYYNAEFRNFVSNAKFRNLNGKDTRLGSFVNSLIGGWKDIYENLADKVRNDVDKFMQKAPRVGFREAMLFEAERRRKEGYESNENIIYPISNTVEFIHLDDLVVESNIRKTIPEESIIALAKEIKEIGQLKPALVVKKEEGKYRVVYGHRRYFASKKAGKEYLKAFVVEKDLSELEVQLLQCHEDLSEQDSPVERARVLHLHYTLMQKQAELSGKEYTPQNFVKDFSHLASRKNLLGALKFMDLDELTRAFAELELIGKGSAIEIGRLEGEDRMWVLFNAMANPYSGRVKEMVDTKIAEKSQFEFEFEIPRAYDAIFRTFEEQARSPFFYFERYGQGILKQINGNSKIYTEFVKYSRSLEKVKNALDVL